LLVVIQVYVIVLFMDNITRFNLAIAGLTQFVEREGHCRVPATHTETVNDTTVPLGSWVGYFRQRHRKGHLPVDKAQKLEQIRDWQWGPLRPGPATNTGRNVKILDLHRGGKSLRFIADEFDLSRQRVHQIVKKMWEGV
jgi:hypothetical protein